MHIIHITASYKPAYIYGGPIMSVAKLCEGIEEQRLRSKEIVELQVFTTTANGKTELDVDLAKPVLVNGVSVQYFKRLTKDHSHFSPALLWHLNKVLRQAQHHKNKKLQTPNSKLIIHIHAWWNLVSILSCLIAKWYNVPVILSPRGMLTSYTFGNRNSLSKKAIHYLLGKKLLKYCHIHATSAKEKDDVIKITKSKNINVIPNLVNLGVKNNYQRTRIKPLETTETFKIIFLSRIEEKKGLELLLDALAKVDFKWSLTIAGSGEAEYIKDLKVKSENLNITQYLTWLGQVKDEQKFDLLAYHDLMALTSYNENFANVVIESLSVGTPVLISKEVGLAEYVSDNHLGWITSLNIEDIKSQLMEAFKNQNLREKINLEANKIIQNDFNETILIEKYVSLYQNIADIN